MAQHEVFVDLNHYRLTNGPIMVSFDTTQLCNLRCVHCFNNSGDQAPNPDLPREQRLDIARQIAEMHPFNVCMCGGESLCCSDLFDIMDVLRPHVGKLSMVSNGFLMTSEMARRLVEHGWIWRRSASMAPTPGSMTASGVCRAPLTGLSLRCAT